MWTPGGIGPGGEGSGGAPDESLVPVRFDPALLNGMAVPGELSLTFDFRRRLASDHPDRERDL